MLVLDSAPSGSADTGAATAYRTLGKPSQIVIANSLEVRARWAAPLAAALRTLAGVPHALVAAPMRRHMERKTTLHALIGLTGQGAGDTDRRGSGRTSPEAGPSPRPSLPPRRPAFRPRRRAALAITAPAVVGMRRIRGREQQAPRR